MASATGLTEDEALALALDLSAAEARARNEAPLPLAQEGPNAGEFRPRSEAHPPLSHHFAQQVPAMGGIISRGALDQFHDFWSAAIGKHQTAGSICGYLTAANCELLSEALENMESSTVSPDDDDVLIEKLMSAVRDPEAVLTRVDAAMRAVRQRREAYIAANVASFSGGSGREASNYCRSWVANYELSALLSEYASSASADSRRRLLFVRMNQFPMLDVATHEERSRILEEEARFGGRITAPGVVVYAAGDAYFCVERFGPSGRQLQSPAEWIADERAQVAALATAGRVQVTWAFDLLFGPLTIGAGGEGRGEGRGEELGAKLRAEWCLPARPADIMTEAGRELSAEVHELMAMGFAQDAARAALNASGSMAAAVEQLLASNEPSPNRP
ncbi:hypothetical protein Ctob_002922 [Chrysochromulina tobinii]|uniref:UBA domain-containing protein n=1 Tax=Chrysochromulina tobinii TaxID=1460289 RepID=A0A0M0JJG4_9EUKA|nr:hypothetical protein Ctob_002922 [Chrysochromulina tobinii]|eukprot:KOO26625.1 hypothetical protein Ctob_002922 [Chrysochromulina sp. CCMP291]